MFPGGSSLADEPCKRYPKMNATVTYTGTMPLRGLDEKGRETLFDTSPEFHGDDSAASPMAVLLEALASCSMMDVISILKKKRHDIRSLTASLEALRAETHPKVFTSITIRYDLSSSDCTLAELEKAVALSIDKYCPVAAMFRDSGCAISWISTII
jgi:putative redox protein